MESSGDATDPCPVPVSLTVTTPSSRIAAAAAASPLAGRGGGGVLEHGRKGLRARGIVGLIAGEDCVLEILPKIDFPGEKSAQKTGNIRRRLVHMLAIALDLKIDVGRITTLDWQRETLLEILIRLFSEKLVDAVRQGMPRHYVEKAGDLPAVRGRLNVTRQLTILAAEPWRLACRFDALTEDIALNQIMKATVSRLARISRTTDNQRRLRELAFAYAEIKYVPITVQRRASEDQASPCDESAADLRCPDQQRQLRGDAELSAVAGRTNRSLPKQPPGIEVDRV